MTTNFYPTWDSLLRDRAIAVVRGDLLSLADARQQLEIPEERLTKKLKRGELFTIDVDGRPYVPSFLVADTSSRERLWELCKLIRPAPADARLGWLLKSHSSLGVRRPVDCLRKLKHYRYAKLLARTWASEWSRTVVALHDGEDGKARGDQPLYQAVFEIDPRVRIWSRVSAAVRSNDSFSGKPFLGRMTLTVSRVAPPDKTIVEQTLQLTLADQGDSVAIQTRGAQTYLLPLLPWLEPRDAKAIGDYVIEHMCSGGQAAGMKLAAAARVLNLPNETVRTLVHENRLKMVASVRRRKDVWLTLESVRSFRIAASRRTLVLSHHEGQPCRTNT